jgi:predicted kinase
MEPVGVVPGGVVPVEVVPAGQDRPAPLPVGTFGSGRGPLVVVGGLPGAGKTCALDQLSARGARAGVVVLDSDGVRRAMRSRLSPVPYPLLRPVVHAVHRIRIAVSAVADRRPLVVHEPATRRRVRAALLVLARLTGRDARLVWVEVTPETALHGQVDRARVVRSRAFRCHLRSVSRHHPAHAASGAWEAVFVTDRVGAADAVLAAVHGRAG